MVLHDLFDPDALAKLNDRQIAALQTRLTRELLTNPEIQSALQKSADRIAANIIRK